jgi:hypothetical protein
MVRRRNNPGLAKSDLIGCWSHGVAYNYYGGSHDYRLILLGDGRGCFIHDGWSTYRYADFAWKVDMSRLVLLGQRYCELMKFTSNRCLQIVGGSSLGFDASQNRQRLDIPFLNEPTDYYLVNRDVKASDLQPELIAAPPHPQFKL